MNLLLPFSFANLPVRGRLLRLTNLSTHVPSLKEHTEATQPLAELLTAAAMLAYDTKHTLGVSLQLQHPDLGVLMFAACGTNTESTAGALRAYANPKAQKTPFTTLAGTAGGIFAVTLEPPQLENRYQSLIPLSQPSAAGCLADYFFHSVQTPTLFVVHANTHQASAIMLQATPVPQGQPPLPDDDWTRLTLLLQTLQEPEALDFTTAPETLLAKLFAEDDLTTFTAEHPILAADDPRPRMLAALAAMDPESLAELMAEGTVTLTDDTSGQSITFTAAELAHLKDVVGEQ